MARDDHLGGAVIHEVRYKFFFFFSFPTAKGNHKKRDPGAYCKTTIVSEEGRGERETRKMGQTEDRQRETGKSTNGIEVSREYLGTRYLVAFKPWPDFFVWESWPTFLFETRPLFLQTHPYSHKHYTHKHDQPVLVLLVALLSTTLPSSVLFSLSFLFFCFPFSFSFSSFSLFWLGPVDLFLPHSPLSSSHSLLYSSTPFLSLSHTPVSSLLADTSTSTNKKNNNSNNTLTHACIHTLFNSYSLFLFFPLYRPHLSSFIAKKPNTVC